MNKKNNSIFYMLFNILIFCSINFGQLSGQTTPATDSSRYDQPYICNGIFTNFNGENLDYLIESAKIFLATQINPQPYYTKPNQIHDWITPYSPLKVSDTPKITWIGHATFLIQIGGINILTDPVFYDLSFLYPRNTPAGINPDDLPPIDVILISHSHRDHLDEKSIKQVFTTSTPIILTPQKTSFQNGSPEQKQSKAFNWWESYSFGKKATSTQTVTSIKFTFLPARHWSNRSPFDVNKSLWGSWMIQYNDTTIYFAGDSAYDEHFKKIAQHFPQIDFALLPIGPNNPRNLMQSSHMSAEEAGQAFIDLNAHTFIPMHWGTFRLGTDSFDTPVTYLTNWWDIETKRLTNKKLRWMKFGQTIG